MKQPPTNKSRNHPRNKKTDSLVGGLGMGATHNPFEVLQAATAKFGQRETSLRGEIAGTPQAATPALNY